MSTRHLNVGTKLFFFGLGTAFGALTITLETGAWHTGAFAWIVASVYITTGVVLTLAWSLDQRLKHETSQTKEGK